MDSHRCHHCGSIGHKKFDCTERCRVGCKWCENPPVRRPPASGKMNSDTLSRQNNNNNARDQQNVMQLGPNNIPQLGSNTIKLAPKNIGGGTSGSVRLVGGSSSGGAGQNVGSYSQNTAIPTMQLGTTTANLPILKPQNVGSLAPAILSQATMQPLAKSISTTWPAIQQSSQPQQQQVSLIGLPFNLQQSATMLTNGQPHNQFQQSQIQLLNGNSEYQSLSASSLPQQLFALTGNQMDQSQNQVSVVPSDQSKEKITASLTYPPQPSQPIISVNNSHNDINGSALENNTLELETQRKKESSQEGPVLSAAASSLNKEQESNVITAEKQGAQESKVLKSNRERKPGETNMAIINKLQVLKNKLKAGQKFKAKSSENSLIDSKIASDLLNEIKQEHIKNIEKSNTAATSTATSGVTASTGTTNNTSITSATSITQKDEEKEEKRLLNIKTEEESSIIETQHNEYRPEFIKSDRDRQPLEFERSLRSRSASPRRGDTHEYTRSFPEYARNESPGKNYSRSVIDYDYRYNSSRYPPGHDKYYSRVGSSITTVAAVPGAVSEDKFEKYYPRSMSAAPYEDYYSSSRYNEKYDERGVGGHYREYEREPPVTRGRSRSPTFYRPAYEDHHNRRFNGSSSPWYAHNNNPYDRDYQLSRTDIYYDLPREDRYERERAYSLRPEAERGGYMEREFSRSAVDFEYNPRRRPLERW
ncbi:13005_t:CDS:2 [Ambispora leptoticha]|uniref:13005_t:CDS:1 n=1 Tax=Ambispora leptoticha TaxID=144679 RepID=A0A9N8W0J9_9GLOM|nr:13005_t:CDS:2 [Ambispora leptoticha]